MAMVCNWRMYARPSQLKPPTKPKGVSQAQRRRWEITANDQLLKAADYRSLIVAYRGGAPVKLADVSQVQDSVQTVRSLGLANGKPAALIIIFRQPGGQYHLDGGRHQRGAASAACEHQPRHRADSRP
jgi:hypothetical protein